MKLNIPVVLGSAREKRNSYFPAKFMVAQLEAAGVDSHLVDFKELPLPFLDSAEQPSDLNKKYPYPNVQKWSQIADVADAFVLVAPEYNHGYSGVIKNALDWLYDEFGRKPFGLVGVSDGPYGGARMIEQLRPIVENFSAFAIRETVNFIKAPEMFDTKGNLTDEKYLKRIDRFIKSLIWNAEAMKKARG